MNIVLFGAGSTGRYCLKYLRSKGIEPFAFADNDPNKWNTTITGIPVMSPYSVNAPDVEWVATAISRPSATVIRAQLRFMGVKTKPLWECLDVHHGLPPQDAEETILRLLRDDESTSEWKDQLSFRSSPNYDRQRPPSDNKDIYFPGFIQHRDDEHYVDCGAADGDTVAEFRKRWSSYAKIVAFEPDPSNYRKLAISCLDDPRNETIQAAVGDHDGNVQFAANGDYSSHIGVGGEDVVCLRLDRLGFYPPPTCIKMDIEGAELEALWGARRTLKEHSPVLAICAYHTSDHLWQIPLLIHAIQPDYRLFFRRYAEGEWEIVWYAVPPERVK